MLFEPIAPIYMNVLTHNVTGNGVTDDGPAINTAILTMIANGGGTLFFPPATYLIATPITIPSTGSGIRLLGAGWNTILKLANSVNDYLIKYSPPMTGMFGNEISHMKLDCNNPNQNAGGGIYAFGAIQNLFHHLYITRSYNQGIYCYQDGNGGTGHHNRIMNCLVDNGQSGAGAGRGIQFQASDENFVINCDIESCGSGATDPAGLADYSGLQLIQNTCFVGCQQAIKIQGNHTHIVGCTFDGCKNHTVQGNGNNMIVSGCTFFQIGFGSGSPLYDGVRLDNVQYCTVTGNTFLSDNTGTESGVNLANGASHNRIVANTFMSQGSGYGSGAVIPGTGTGNKIADNKGYNPVGPITAPAIPASGTAYTNSFGVDAMVLVTGGTVSQIALGGTNTGQTSGWFRVPATQTITLTYTVAPSWQWYGD